MPSINIYFPEAELKQLREKASDQCVSVSEVVRKAVKNVSTQNCQTDKNVEFMRKLLELSYETCLPETLAVAQKWERDKEFEAIFGPP